MSNGVRQGRILSPLLRSGIGCYMGSLPANIYGYPDDIVILAPIIFVLKKLIFLCEQYSEA